MVKENTEGSQEKSDLRATEKNTAETKNYLREKLGKSQERPGIPEQSEGCEWRDRQDHAAKVSRILGEQAGTFESKVLKKQPDYTDSGKGSGGQPPSSDQGRDGGGSGSLRRSMEPVPVDKQSAEVTEQKRREETLGHDHQPTTAQASRFDHRSTCQRLDRPPNPPGQGTENTRGR